MARYSISTWPCLPRSTSIRHGVALIAARQHRDALRHGRGKQQAAFFRRHRLQHEFEIFAKAEIEHLVGFVEHHDRQRGNIQRPALDMVAQAPRRAHDDMDARLQGAALALRVHAADAGADARAGMAIEPGQLALDLQRQFARRRDDERERRAGRRQERQRRRAASAPSRRHRRRSCRSRSGPKPEDPGQMSPARRRRPEPASAPDSRAPPAPGRGRDSM